jgi:ABC-2 type transport system permease protein
MVLAEFKLKYAGSVLGYVWSVVKPLSLFTIMYLVFGRLFKLDDISPYYPVALLIGIVLFSFFSDATSQGMVSLVHRESLLRRLRFPRMLIPAAATLTAAMTFAVNFLVVGGFVAWEGIVPQLDWLLIPFLLLELYLFTFGIALILTTLFVSLRDMAQVWELGVQLLFYASPVVYPASFLPSWARDLVFLFPPTQVMQDVRALVLYDDHSGLTITASDVLGAYGRLLPIATTLIVLAFGAALFKRHEPWFAERT